PRIRDGNNMDFIKIESLDKLELNKTFNIKEPIFDQSNIIDSKNIDLMFIPLIGFDKYNHRLGYGKGYYDRYLKNNNNILTFGLGYKETNIEENIFDELDISLQKIIFK
ncbi:MAG: 5-formyltetrahydrofolate cyclo-ligase, partial [Mollicutes bacterium]|nr:5-formyltetrahydrofolate cyclo-ligase [Mollicutes bacterium]